MITDLCPHGQVLGQCQGQPTRGIAPCQPGDHHYCPHGIDTHLETSDHQPRCPTCRGVRRGDRNARIDTPHRAAAQYTFGDDE